MKITGVTVFPVNLPLKQTFRTALGAKKITKNVWVRIDCGKELSGFGEASSSLALPHATQDKMCRAISTARSALIGTRFNDWREPAHSLRKKFIGMATALSAVECALLDLYCRSRRISAAHYFGARANQTETYYTIPALPPALCAGIARRLANQKFTKFKIKVTGREPLADLKRVKSICNTIGVREVIIDANQGWTADACLRFVDLLKNEKPRIVLIEQPLPKSDLRGLKFLKKRSDIPIAVDESFNSLDTARKIVDHDASDVFNIKLAKCGLLESIRIAQYLRKVKKKLMIGCMMESLVGLSASLQWAMGSGQFSFADLDSALLLKPLDIVSCIKNTGPIYKMKPNSAGLGTTADF